MTQVRFLHGAQDRIQAASAWIGAAWARREQVLVYATQRDLAERLDRQLWIAPALSFVPHCLGNSPLREETPILITANLDPNLPHQTLLNLRNETPPDFLRFATLVEVVSAAPEVRDPARERVRHYKEQHCEVLFEDVSHGH